MSQPDIPLSVEDHFNKRVNEEVERLTAQLTSGACPDHATYKYVVGRIQGFEEAKMIFEALIAQWKNQ